MEFSRSLPLVSDMVIRQAGFASACFGLVASSRYQVHPELASGLLIQIQLISRTAGLWVHLHPAAYSAGVR